MLLKQPPKAQSSILTMATSILLRGLRPHELVILDELCGFGLGIGEFTEGIGGGSAAAVSRETQRTAPGTPVVPSDFASNVVVLSGAMPNTAIPSGATSTHVVLNDTADSPVVPSDPSVVKDLPVSRETASTDPSPSVSHGTASAPYMDAESVVSRETHAVPETTLATSIASRFPDADLSPAQFESALRALDHRFLMDSNRKRFGGIPLIKITERRDGLRLVRLSPAFAQMLRDHPTFRAFFKDAVHVALLNCRDLFVKARHSGHIFDRGFLIGQQYALSDIMRLCCWAKENNPQNVGGYALDCATGTMPIMVKYASSQYDDEFLSPQEMRWFSKNKRTLISREFRWLRGEKIESKDGKPCAADRFIPLFVMRREDAEWAQTHSETPFYYYVGHVAAVQDSTEMRKPTGDGSGEEKVVVSTLRLAQPLSPELFRYLTGKHTL